MRSHLQSICYRRTNLPKALQEEKLNRKATIYDLLVERVKVGKISNRMPLGVSRLGDDAGLLFLSRRFSFFSCFLFFAL